MKIVKSSSEPLNTVMESCINNIIHIIKSCFSVFVYLLVFGIFPSVVCADEIFVADIISEYNPTSRILKVDTITGTQTEIASGGIFFDPIDIAKDNNGDLIIADINASGGSGAIIRLNLTTLVPTIISSGGLFLKPRSVAIDARGDIIVANENASNNFQGGIVRVDPNTGNQTLISSGGHLIYPHELVIDSNGDLLVTLFHGGVVKVDPQNGAQTLISSGSLFANGGGIVQESNGDILVTDWGAGKVIRVDPTTGAHTLVSSGGLLVNPMDIKIGSNGELFVLDPSSPSGPGIIKVDPSTGAQTAISSGGLIVTPQGMYLVGPSESGIDMVVTNSTTISFAGDSGQQNSDQESFPSATWPGPLSATSPNGNYTSQARWTFFNDQDTAVFKAFKRIDGSGSSTVSNNQASLFFTLNEAVNYEINGHLEGFVTGAAASDINSFNSTLRTEDASTVYFTQSIVSHDQSDINHTFGSGNFSGSTSGVLMPGNYRFWAFDGIQINGDGSPIEAHTRGAVSLALTSMNERQIVEIGFTANIIADTDEILGIGAGNSATVLGTIQYDASMPDIFSQNPEVGIYPEAFKNASFSVNGNDLYYDFSRLGSDFTFAVGNEPGSDIFQTVLEPANAIFTDGPLVGTSITQANMGFGLLDSTGTVFSSDALAPLPTTGWDSSTFQIVASTDLLTPAFNLIGTIDFQSLTTRIITGPNTPSGGDVIVNPPTTDPGGEPVLDAPSVSLEFDDVSEGGDTTVTVTEQGPPPPAGFRLGNPPVYLNIETDATFIGGVDICIDYSNISYGGSPENLKLAHFVNGAWEDITTSNDTVSMILCGRTTSLSPFAIFESADPIDLLNDLVDTVAALNAKNGIINSLDVKLSNAKEALIDAKLNNDHSAINVLLSAFTNAVEAQSGKQLLYEEAKDLLIRAEEIALVLAGDPVL